jgi:hypothetical protein
MAVPNPDGGGPEPAAAARRSDFLVAATGGRRFATALLLAPTAIGLMLGLLAFLFRLNAGAFPAMLRDPNCLLLLRNLTLYCLVLGPAAAASFLFLRWPKIARSWKDGPPAIEMPYRIVAAVGGLTILIAGPHFYLYGRLSQAVCRMSDDGGLAGLLAAGSVVALLSPLVTTTAVTTAYALLRYEHGRGPMHALPTHVPVGGERAHMKRRGIPLLALALILFGYMVGSMQGGNRLLIGAELLILGIGFLLVRGSLAAARFGAWCIAFAMPTLIADMLLPPLLQPLELTVSMVQHRFLPMLGLIAFHLAFLAGTIWIYRRLRAPQILGARAMLGRATAAPWTGLVTGAAVLLFTFYATHRQLDEFDVLRAREMAETQYGKDLSYYISGLRYQDGQVHADVTAYGGDSQFSFEVYWIPKARGA